MKFSVFAVFATLLTCTQAAANFKSTVNVASAQMNRLGASIAQIRAVASAQGHNDIISQCNLAEQHLGYAQSSWNGISSGFSMFPWRARQSAHGTQTIQRLAACGNILDWIYRQPRVRACSDYQPHISRCQTSYNNCQSSCGQIWNWPSPPTPSQYAGYRRHRRSSPITLCPASETACPITIEKSGYECIDTQTEITSCGGCESLKQGENCLAIIGADEVGCHQGQCRVFSALPGFEMDPETGRPQAQSYTDLNH